MGLRVTTRGSRLQISGTVEGQRVRKTTGLPVGQRINAEYLRASIEAQVLAKRVKRQMTVAEGAHRYLRRPEGIGQTAALYVERFAEEFGDQQLTELDAGEVYEWVMDAATQKRKAVSTIRREIGAIEACVSWSAKAAGLKSEFSLQKPGGAEPRLRFLEREEVQAMVAAAEPWFRPMVLALFYSGMRRSEAANLKWGDVRNGKFVIATKKGRVAKTRYRNVPIHKSVMGAIGAAKGRPVGDYVFTDDRGEPWTDKTRINKEWKRTAERAGVPDCTPHDARRTFASWLLEKGTDLRTIADLLGHTSLDLLMVYAQVRGAVKAQAVESLDDL